MRYLLLSITILSGVFSSAQDWKNEKEDLNGRVKLIAHSMERFIKSKPEPYITWFKEYTYNRNGYCINYERSKTENSSPSNVTIRDFDTSQTICLRERSGYNGDTSRLEEFFYIDSTLVASNYYIDGELWRKSVYEFNKNGALINEVSFLHKDGDTIVDSYRYNENAQKTSFHHISSSSERLISWTYDLNGNCIQEKSELIKAPGTVIISIQPDGSEKKEYLVVDPDDYRHYIIDFVYDNQNLKVREIKKFMDGRVQHDLSFKYFNNGDLKVEYNTGVDASEGINYEYRYDSENNWIEKIHYIDKRVIVKETRKIEYF